MKKFTNESMLEILRYFNKNKENKEICIEVLNPDFGENAYAGAILTFENEEYIYRSFKAWNDLAEIMFFKLLLPEKISTYTISLKFKKLNQDSSFHKQLELKTEKYGLNSDFFLINKSEEPSFIHYYSQALKNIRIKDRKKIINLGINRADEFEVIQNILNKDEFNEVSLTGIDFCQSAIDIAQKRFPNNSKFYKHDINDLPSLSLGKFDLLISIGTLQSSSLNFKLLFMSLVQELLEKDSALILGFPNCRWIDGEMIYGAKAKNYSYSELSVMHKDIYFCKKYLQQKKFRVTITGKNYLFLSASKINI
ncbi:MAG: methyltransferase domain-containing protein [Campylobacteraceae bacterium]|nr:methyltransferase domain-containing protein [Campylobacteraceae bacterium]